MDKVEEIVTTDNLLELAVPGINTSARAIDRGSTAEARAYTKSVMNKKNVDALNDMGKIEFLDKRYNKAKKWFKKAMMAKQKDATFNMSLLLGTIYKKFDKAVFWLREDLKDNKNSEKHLIAGGDFFIRLNKRADAIKMFEKAFEAESLIAATRLADIYMERRSFEQAKQYLTFAANKGDIHAALILGTKLKEQGQTEDAIKHLKTAADSGSGVASMLLGDICFKQLGELTMAEKYYASAFSKNIIGAGKKLILTANKSKNFKSVISVLQLIISEMELTESAVLGDVLFKKEDYKNAKICYDYILEKDPSNVGVLLALAHIEKFYERFDSACMLLDEAIGLGSALARVKKADVINDCYKDYPLAASHYEQIFVDYDPRTNPDAAASPELSEKVFSDMALNLSILYFVRANDNMKGQAWYRRALEQNPDTDYKIGEAFEQSARFDQSAEWYLKAVERGNLNAKFRLGRLFDEELKDYMKAKKWYGLAAADGHTEAKYKMGMMYINKTQEYAMGRKCLEAAVEDNYEPAMLELAAISEREGNFHHAIVYYGKSAKLGNKASLLKAAELSEDTDDVNSALKFYEQIYAFDKSVALKIARNYLKYQKDFPKAVKWYQTVVLQAERNDKDIYYELATAYVGTKERSEALKCLRLATELGSIEALCLGGDVCRDEKDYKNAEEWYDRGIAIGSTDCLWHKAKMYHYNIKDFRKASKLYELAIDRKDLRVQEDYKKCLAVIEQALVQQKRFEAAVEDGKMQSVMNLAQNYERIGDYEKAKETYLKAISGGVLNSDFHLAVLFDNKLMQFDMAEFYYLEAAKKKQAKTGLLLARMAQFKMKDFGKAERYYLQAIKEGATAAYVELGRLYHQTLRQPMKAIPYYLKGVEMNDIEATYSVGMLYNEIGDKQSAMLMLDTAANSGHTGAMMAKAAMFERAGQYENALKSYHEAVKKGVPKASYALGVIYARDYRDEENATKWLTHAASLGVQEAMPALRIYFPAKKGK